MAGLGDLVLTCTGDLSRNRRVGLLLAQGKSIATAESCTGGYIASQITTVPGCSAYYYGSVVSYTYESKQALLGVKQETLDQHGAVSEEVACAMALAS